MTGSIMRAHDLIGQPVVDISTGDDLAEIKDVIFDASQGAIKGFTLRKRGVLGRKLKGILTVDRVASVGTHAVMVANSGSMSSADDEHVVSVSNGDNVLDDLVITESGRTLGHVRDVIIVGGPEPMVVGFEIGGGSVGDGLIPVAAKTGVSGSALIVPDSYEQRIRTDLTGFAAELTNPGGGM